MRVVTAPPTRDTEGRLGEERPCGEECLTFVNQGARVRVCASDSRALSRVERVLPVGSRVEGPGASDTRFVLSGADDSSEVRPYRLYHGSSLLQSARRLDPLLKRLESELHHAVACHARSSLFVHAGVVGWRDRAILLPGRSMSGKSSLVAALLRAGAEYYSDEYAVVDVRGRVHPYPRPLNLRVRGEGTRQIPPERLGCKVGARPLRAGLIVSTRYSEAERFDPEERGSARGLMILIDNTVVVRERPRFALDHLISMVRDATILEGERGEADEAAAWMLRHPVFRQQVGAPRPGGNGLPARGA